MIPLRRLGAALLALATGLAAAQELPPRTALDDYVQAPDDAYGWEIVSTTEAEDDGLTTIVVEMTSQRWLTDEEVDRTEWKHWLTLAIPDGATARTALLNIGGGGNRSEAPTAASDRILPIAKGTGTVVAELRMVPNQPLTFHDDGQERYEDDLIGYAWDQFLATGEPRWLPHAPMVKSAVRAMDTVTAVMASEAGGKLLVDRFVVAGASKRGWTTWLTGAMDDRVVAIIPLVIDVLNVQASMEHHFAAYGFWAPAIGDYVRHGIMQRMDHPRLAELYELMDPINYRHRLTMPKLVLNASGDEFFLPDSSQFYWPQLRGENYLRYVPNAGHGLAGTDVLETVTAFHSLIVRGEKPPQLFWSRTEDGGLDVLTVDQPKAVNVWIANNPQARDFRMESLGAAYSGNAVVPEENMSFSTTYNVEPKKGWTAWFVEAEYDVGAAVPLKLTTEVVVTPSTLPYADKPAQLPTSITAACMLADADAAKALAEDATANAPLPVAETQVLDKRAFLNWQPEGDMAVSVRTMFDYLREKQCATVLVQMESGPGITLPPLAAVDEDER